MPQQDEDGVMLSEAAAQKVARLVRDDMRDPRDSDQQRGPGATPQTARGGLVMVMGVQDGTTGLYPAKMQRLVFQPGSPFTPAQPAQTAANRYADIGNGSQDCWLASKASFIQIGDLFDATVAGTNDADGLPIFVHSDTTSGYYPACAVIKVSSTTADGCGRVPGNIQVYTGGGCSVATGAAVLLLPVS